MGAKRRDQDLTLVLGGTGKTVGRVADQALAGGVCKLVLLSGRGEGEAQHCEAALQSKTVDWTILRASPRDFSDYAKRMAATGI